MRLTELQAVQAARPFKAYRLHLSDGRSLRVSHPEFVAIHPKGRTVIVFGTGESFDILDSAHISSIEVGNGRRRPADKSR